MKPKIDWVNRVGRNLGLRDLHILLTVAECGSMSKAAAQLGITHSVVSKTIAALELRLDARLLDRNSQGAELTVQGRALLRCGTIVFDELRRGIRETQSVTGAPSGELCIGCAEALTTLILPAIVERFLDGSPDIRLHVIGVNPGLQFEELRKQSVELLIAELPTSLFEDDLLVESLHDEELAVIAGVSSSWAKRRHIELAELLQEQWIMPPGDSALGSLVATIFNAGNLELPPARLVSASIQLTNSLVSTGTFLAFMPRSAADFSDQVLCLRLSSPNLSEHRLLTNVISLKHQSLSPLAKIFFDCARDVANFWPKKVRGA
jgi:DNA-binding transcriptional LysR family regulator